MLRSASGDSRGFGLTAIGLCAGLMTLALAVTPADARGHHRHGVAKRSGGDYTPPYAAIVLDANSGAVLHASEPDGLRHPASLTKVMTLYLLFERLEQGKIRLDTQLPVSAHAASMAPSKLGLKAGSTIAVEDAIRAVCTKSANDIAVVIAEAIGGDESTFAQMMTQKARALGMSRTTYVNASGLPDDDQITTARDQATLGRAIQERFPRYSRYFSTPYFTYRGETMRNHNHLLGSVEGVDGIKTGYTHKSGFNLITSVRRNNRHIVSVVLGGASAGARDARMRALIDKYIVEASLQHTAPMVAEAKAAGPAKPRTMLASAADVPFASTVTGSAKPMTPPARAEASATIAKPAPGSSEPIKPIAVKTIKVKLGAVQSTSLAPAATVAPIVPATPLREERIGLAAAATPSAPAAAISPAPAAPPPAAVAIPAAAPAVLHPAPVATPIVAQPAPTLAPQAEPEKIALASAKSESVILAKIEAEPAHKSVHTGWIIQVGAFAAEREAKERLSSAQSKARSFLAGAEPFTEAVTKGDKTFYRARFAGLGKDEAETACKHLKRNDIACMTLRN